MFSIVVNCTFRAFWNVDIFIYMDDKQFSPELTTLLSKLNKGHRVDMGRVVHGLSDVERDIFMEALNQKSKVQREQFAKLIKGKD